MIRINLLGQPRPKDHPRLEGPPEATLQIVLLLLSLAFAFGVLWFHWHQLSNDVSQRQGQIRALQAQKTRSEEHTSELQSLAYLVCRLLLEKKKKNIIIRIFFSHIIQFD